MAQKDSPPAPITADEADDENETIAVSGRPVGEHTGIAAPSPAAPSSASSIPPPSQSRGAMDAQRSVPVLADFADEEEETHFLRKESFLGETSTVTSGDAAASPPVRPKVRALENLENMPLTAHTSEGQATSDPVVAVSIVASDDDDDDDVETVVHLQRPRRLHALPPIEDRSGEAPTVSQPVVHRRTIRPSGEGTPQKALEAAGGLPSTPFDATDSPSAIALPVEGGASNTVQAKGPLFAPRPTDGFDQADDTQTVNDAGSDLTPDLLSLGLSLSNSDEGTDTALDLRPPIRPIGPESETQTLQRAQPEAALGARGPATAPFHPALDDEISAFDEGALVVDDQLPDPMAASTPEATSNKSGSVAERASQQTRSRRALPTLASPHAADAPSSGGPQVHTSFDLRADDLDSVAEDEPGTLLVRVPDEAIVFVDGTEVGQGTLSINGLDRFTTYALRVHCPGCLPWSGSATLRGTPHAEVTPELRTRRG